MSISVATKYHIKHQFESDTNIHLYKPNESNYTF